MKKILLIILCVISFMHFERSYAQDMDEFDLQAIGGFDDNCDCGEENFRFGISNFNTVNYNIAAGINNFVFQNWVNVQQFNIENRIENLTGKEFSSYREASLEVVKDNVTYQGAYWKNHLNADDYPEYYNSIENRKLNLIELQHLQIRRNEIQRGNINNSVFSFSKVNGRFLKDIKDISDLNTTQNTIRDYYEVNSETEFIARNFRNKITRFDRIGFGSYMKKKVDKYWDKELKNSFWDKLFGRTNNELADRAYLSQFYTNMYMLYPPNHFSQLNDLDASEYIGYENTDTPVIKDMPKGRSGNILGFVWGDMPDFNVNFEELLNSFSEEDILSDLKIVGLGQDNNDFLNTRLDLRTEIAEYFKENDLSQVSHDAINYLLSQYVDNKMFVLGSTDVYKSSFPTLLNDSENPERALEFCFDSGAKDHGLPNFGFVLAAFSNEVNDDNHKDNNYKGFIIREIFDARGIQVPTESEVPNTWYGENFKFVNPPSGNCIKVSFDNDNDGYLPNWFVDKDKDGYHAKGTLQKKQATSPGTGWVQGVSKGEDCNDTKPYLTTNCSTWDEKTNQKISQLQACIQQSAFNFVNELDKLHNIKVRIYMGYRTINEQNELYSRGRTQTQLNAVGLTNVTAQPNLRIVTNAYGGKSYHNYGIAFDLVEINSSGQALWNNPNWDKIGKIGESFGFEWGGNWKSFKDRPHFQMTNGNSVNNLLNGSSPCN